MEIAYSLPSCRTLSSSDSPISFRCMTMLSMTRPSLSLSTPTVNSVSFEPTYSWRR